MTQPGENVGNVYVELVPDADQFAARVGAKVLPAAEQLGKDISRRISAPIAGRINESIRDGLKVDADVLAAADRVGQKIGDRVGAAIRRGIEDRLKAPFTITVDADTKAADKKITALEKRIAAISSKNVKIRVDVDDSGLGGLSIALAALHPLATVNVDVDVSAALTQVASLEGALSGIQSIASQLPALDMDVAGALSKIGQLQSEIQAAQAATSLNLDLDTGAATAQLAAFSALVSGLSPSLAIQVQMPDADDIGRRIGREAGNEFAEAFRRAVQAAPPPPTPGPPGSGPGAAGNAGRRDGSAYGDRFRAAVEQSMRNLPEPRLVLGRRLNQEELEVREVYRRLQALRDVEIGVDINQRDAEEELRQLEALLFGLQQRAERGSTLEFNTRAAQESLRRFVDELNNAGPDPARTAANGRQAGSAFGRAYAAGVGQALNNIPEVEIDGDTSEIDRDIEFVRRRLQFLQNARIGIDIDEEEAAREIDRLRQDLIRLGQMSPSVQVRADTQQAALQLANLQRQLRQLATDDPDVNVDVDTGAAELSLHRLTASAVVAQAAVYGIGVAGLSMVTILIPAAAAAAAAIGAIAVAAFGAVAAMGVAALALSGIVGAVQAVTAAQEETGQGAAQAASRMNALRSAADGVRNAERSLADAQKDAKRAQEDLTEARKAAREENEDLALSIRGNALAQARAQDDLAEAEEAYNKIKDDPGASEEAKRDARLTFEEAKLRVDELATRAKRLGEAEEEARRKGIEGSDQVVAAKDRISAAQQRVIQATEALAAAHRQQAQAAQSAGNTTSAAAKKAQEALAGLSPAGREFVRFIIGLKDTLLPLRQAAETAFLPGLQRGIEAMLPVLPAVTLLISRFGAVLGGLAEDAGKFIGGPFFAEFLEFLGTSGAKAFESFARAAGYVLKAILSIVMAFGPFAETFGEGLLGLSRDFAEWAEGFGKSEAFQAFIDYVTAQGPKVLTILADLAIVAFKLAVALVPLATLALEGLLQLVEWLASLSPGQLLGIAAGIGGVAAAIAILAGGPVTLIIAGIALVVAGLVYAYQKFDDFRLVVDTVAGAWLAFAKVMFKFWKIVFEEVIKPAAKAWGEFAVFMAETYTWLWEHALKPAGEAIGRAALWLWKNVLEPAWRGIQVAVAAAWVVLEPIFRAIAWIVTNVVGPAISWLYRQVIKPVFEAAVIVISVAWVAIQVIFGLFVAWFKILGSIVSAFYTAVIRPTWNAIADTISSVWNTRIKPILDLAGRFISESVAPKFRAGVDLLIFWWQALRDGLKQPIKFVVETVINNGLLGAYRWIAQKFDLPNKDIRVPMPPGFATGGHVQGFGSGTSDSIMARLSNGEYVIPAAIVRQYGVQFFDWLIGRNRTGTQYGDLPGQMPRGFKDGGIVGWLGSAWDAISDPVGEITKRVTGLINEIPGGEIGKTIIAGTAKKMMTDVVGHIGNVWGGFWGGGGGGGPTGPGPGFPPWPSSPGAQRGDSGVWRSILNLIRVAGIPYQFGNAYRHGDPLWHGSGRAVDLMGYQQDRLASFFMGMAPRMLELIHLTNKRGYFITRGRVQGNMPVQGPLHRNHIHAAMAGGGYVDTGHLGRNIHYGMFDTGGWLMPGLTYAYNGTGRPERILTEPQWDAMNQRGQQSGATYNVYPQRADFKIQDLDAMVRRQDALMRVGRPA